MRLERFETVMQEVTLTIYDVETGEEERVNLDSRRFTIGRLPENDLAIEDTNLSRRHAVIETVEGSIMISDCGSQNGTFVNGNPVAGAVELHDGDVLTFGGSTEITVEISREYAHEMSYAAPIQTPVSNRAGGSSSVIPPWVNAPVLAGAAVVLILLGAGILIALNQSSSPTPRVASTPSRVPTQSSPVVKNPQVEPEPARVAETPAQETKVEPSDKPDQLIDKYARSVMSSISDDRNPFLPGEVVGEVTQRVKTYNGSPGLRDGLRAVKQRGLADLADAAQKNRIKPALAIFAALAKMDRSGQRGDPISVAKELMPTLGRLEDAFGTEMANDSLLIVATIDQPFQGNLHPLQITLSRLSSAAPQTAKKIRTVWYLYKNQKISSQAYDFVLRFLAIGVIAQDPRHFGIDAEPLVFDRVS